MSVAGVQSTSRPGRLVFAGAVVLVVLLAGRSLANAWSLAPDLGHGWALPWLMGWLVWERTSALPVDNEKRTPDAWTWALLGGGLLIYALLRLFLEPFPLWPALLWILGAGLYGFLITSAWLAGGRRWVWALAAPLALVFTAIPWPTAVENAFLNPVREGLAAGVAELLNLFSVPAFAEGTTIRISGGVVGVDEACGGMRSLQTSLLIGWFVGELARMRPGRRVVLLLCAAAAAIAGNFLRAFVLTLLMDAGGAELLDRWHDAAGYLALASTLVVVLGLGWWWRNRAPQPSLAGRDGLGLSKSSVGWALAALGACAVIEVGVRGWYGSRDREVRAVPTWAVRWPRHEAGFKTFALSDRAREMLKPDGFSSAAWRAAGGGDRSGYYIEWDTGQAARNTPFMHSPEVCLPLTGIELVGRELALTVDVADVRLPFDVYEFRQHERPMFVFRVIWNPDEGRASSPPSQTASLAGWMREKWTDVAERRIAVRAQVLTLAVSGEPDRVRALEAFRADIQRIVQPEMAVK